MKAVCLGGGEGAKATIQGVRPHFDQVTGGIATTDSGRSTKIAREKLGCPLGLGDIRNVLTSLVDEDDETLAELARVLQMRATIPDSEFNGMAVGNFLMAVYIYHCNGDVEKAIDLMHRLLITDQTRIEPISLDSAHIWARLEDGSVRFGEVEVRAPNKPKIRSLHLDKPNARLNPKIEKAILEADLVTLGPGSVMSSLGACSLYVGMKEALSQCPGIVVYILNTTTQIGQTDNWSAFNHVNFFDLMLGFGVIDIVLANSVRPDESVILKLKSEGRDYIEVTEQQKQDMETRVVRIELADVTEEDGMSRDGEMGMWRKDDTIRHDPVKLGPVLFRLAREHVCGKTDLVFSGA